jgi:hypothetical protein
MAYLFTSSNTFRVIIPGRRRCSSPIHKPSGRSLESFHVDLSAALEMDEEEKLPKLGRVLMISDDSGELVWLVEPARVEEALEVLKKERNEGELLSEVGWR